MVTRKSTAVGRTSSKPAAPPSPARRKVAAPSKPAPAAKLLAAPAEAAKVKHKLVRDSFTIPKSEYAVLEDLKQRAIRLMRPTKKGELLRAGIVALNTMSDAAFLVTLNAVPSLKTGRPKKLKVLAAKADGKKA